MAAMLKSFLCWLGVGALKDLNIIKDSDQSYVLEQEEAAWVLGLIGSPRKEEALRISNIFWAVVDYRRALVVEA